MNANELKVGDWVSYNGENYPITDSSDDDVVTITNENNFEMLLASKLKPIELTGKILTNNGWKHHVDNGKHCYTKEDMELWQCYMDSVLSYTFTYYNQALRYVSYVHELQNLLWALGLDDELKL